MNNKAFPNNQETAKLVLRIKARVSKGNNLIELGLQNGLASVKAIASLLSP